MNKQLINKYKPEFDHWLNEGSILARVITSDEDDFMYTIWYVVDSNDLEKWKAEYLFNLTNTQIEFYKPQFIINDEYVEFRKALAEGKTIQCNAREGQNDITYTAFGHNWWVDTTEFKYATNFYRIKPDEPKFKIPAYFKELSSGIVVEFTEELSNNLDVFSNPERWEYLPNYKEPKFKVGDFVKVTPKSHRAITNSGPTEFIGIIKHIDKYTLYNVKGINDTDWFEFDDIQLWTPVKDEWCWFYDNKDSKYSHLAQFYDMNISEDNSLSTFMSSPITKWYYCEPFLNSRPSNLKDK